jgi:glucose/arabinose dehydrogenase
VISPGGLIVYSGKLFPQWAGDLFIGGLSSEALVRVDVNGTTAAKGDQWPMGSRIRAWKKRRVHGKKASQATMGNTAAFPSNGCR